MTTTKTAHTPTPWYIDKDFPIIVDNRGSAIADCNYCAAKSEDVNNANAALIVKAVNNHEKLTNGIAQLLKFYKDTQGLDLPELEALLNEVES